MNRNRAKIQVHIRLTAVRETAFSHSPPNAIFQQNHFLNLLIKPGFFFTSYWFVLMEAPYIFQNFVTSILNSPGQFFNQKLFTILLMDGFFRRKSINEGGRFYQQSETSQVVPQHQHDHLNHHQHHHHHHHYHH